MSGLLVYAEIRQLIDAHVASCVDESSRERLAVLVTGMVKAHSAAPAAVAQALEKLGLSDASAASIERRVRRIENDPELSATLCVHPFAVLSLVTADICPDRPGVVWSDETRRRGTNDHRVDDPCLAGDSTHLVLHWICRLACAGESQTSEVEASETVQV